METGLKTRRTLELIALLLRERRGSARTGSRSSCKQRGGSKEHSLEVERKIRKRDREDRQREKALNIQYFKDVRKRGLISRFKGAWVSKRLAPKEASPMSTSHRRRTWKILQNQCLEHGNDNHSNIFKGF